MNTYNDLQAPGDRTEPCPTLKRQALYAVVAAAAAALFGFTPLPYLLYGLMDHLAQIGLTCIINAAAFVLTALAARHAMRKSPVSDGDPEQRTRFHAWCCLGTLYVLVQAITLLSAGHFLADHWIANLIPDASSYTTLEARSGAAMGIITGAAALSAAWLWATAWLLERFRQHQN